MQADNITCCEDSFLIWMHILEPLANMQSVQDLQSVANSCVLLSASCSAIIQQLSFSETIIITDPGHASKLLGWLAEAEPKGVQGGKQWRLLYRASRDGFGARDFHSRCDNKGPTVVLIRSDKGLPFFRKRFLFGGYAAGTWTSETDVPKSYPGSFIYTLVNPSGILPTKFPCTMSHSSVYCDPEYGPCFGHGDIHIYGGDCIGHIHFPTSYADTVGRGLDTITGDKEFNITDYEVFGCQ